MVQYHYNFVGKFDLYRTAGSFDSKTSSVLKSALRNHHHFFSNLDFSTELHISALKNFTSLLLQSVDNQECHI